MWHFDLCMFILYVYSNYLKMTVGAAIYMYIASCKVYPRLQQEYLEIITLSLSEIQAMSKL